VGRKAKARSVLRALRPALRALRQALRALQEAVRVRVLPHLGLASARGCALFFGAFALANGLAMARSAPATQDVWWIDLSWAPQGLAAPLVLISAALLFAWGLAPRTGPRRRLATSAAAAALALAALHDVLAFYGVRDAGTIVPAVLVPASALFVLAFAWVAWRAWTSSENVPGARGADLAAAGMAFALALAFPVVQVAFFGTTDYRRPADAAVVLGAKVYASGVLSTTVEDRVRTGVDLYKAGLVSRLVMSGAVGESGVDEPVAMRDRAVAMGVPAGAVLLDHAGENTEATVRETTAIFAANGIRSVLAVSQFYHLPRIKMAYRAAGWDVCTVPATKSRYIIETPWLVMREVPAFWSYWARTVL